MPFFEFEDRHWLQEIVALLIESQGPRVSVAFEPGLADVRSAFGPVSLPYEPDLKVVVARPGRPDAGVVSVSPACSARTRFSLQAGGFSRADRVYAPHALCFNS
jgi:hypothetical protein